MKRMLTEYRVGPGSSVPPCGRFLCLPSQDANEAAERDLSVGVDHVGLLLPAVGGDPWGRRPSALPGVGRI